MAPIRPIHLERLQEPGFVLPQWLPTDPVPEGFVQNVLEWHQIVGVCSLLVNFFKAEEGPALGMLVADDVGVGKTLTNYAFMAMVTHITDLAAAKQPLPPILGMSLL